MERGESNRSGRRRGGIGSTLRNALIGVSAFSLLAAVVGSGAMWVIDRAQGEMIDRGVPAVIDAQSLVEHSSRIIAALPAFAKVSSHAELIQHERRLNEDGRRIKALLQEFDRRGVGRETVRALQSILEHMSNNLIEQVALLSGRLQFTRRQADGAAAVFEHTDAIGEALRPAIESLSRQMQANSARLRDPAPGAAGPGASVRDLSQAVGRDVQELERMLEIRFRAEVARRTVEQLLLETDWRKIEDHRADFDRHLAALRLRTAALEDGVHRHGLSFRIDALARISAAPEGVFALRSGYLDVSHGIEILSAENTSLSVEINDLVRALVEEARTAIHRAAGGARFTVEVSRYSLIAIAVLAFAASILIVWRYVSRNVLLRLNRLSELVHRLAHGELDVEVNVSGSDELSDMAEAVLVFRDNAERLRQQEDEITLHVEKLAASNAGMQRVMKALQESEERYDLAVEGASVGLWDWNTRTGALYWSPRFKEILGVNDEVIVPSFAEFKDRLHPDDKERVLAAIRAHLNEREAFVIEYRIRQESGTFIWVSSRGQALWDADGRPTRMAGSIVDIQDRKLDQIVRSEFHRLASTNSMGLEQKVQELLRLSLHYLGLSIGLVARIDGDRYQVIFAESPDNVIEPGAAFALGETYCERTLAADDVVSFHHTSQSDMAGHPCYANTGLEAYIGIPLLVNGRWFGTVNFSDGKPRDTAFTDRELSFVALIAQWIGYELGRQEHIDSLEASQEELRQKTEEQRLIFDHVPVRIWYKDDQNNILRLNRRAASMGLSVEEAEGVNYYDLLGEAAARFHRDDLDIINAGEPRLGVVEEYTRDERHRHWLRTDKVPYTDPKTGKRNILIASTDITTQKEAEFKLAASVEELQRSNAELEQFAYVASHDLKAPLRGIDNLASWIEEDMAEAMNEESREHMGLLRGRVRRLEALLSDLLAYSRVGRIKTEIAMVDMDELIDEVFDLNRPGDGYRLEKSGAMPVFATARVPMEQLLRNLFSNALKHHDRDSGVITVAVANRGDRYEFSVRDDGPGIPVDLQDRIFGMFQTLQSRDAVEGSGMGLAIVKKLIESLGCWIKVESDPEQDRGTCFRFTWPKEWPGTKADAFRSAAE